MQQLPFFIFTFTYMSTILIHLYMHIKFFYTYVSIFRHLLCDFTWRDTILVGCLETSFSWPTFWPMAIQMSLQVIIFHSEKKVKEKVKSQGHWGVKDSGSVLTSPWQLLYKLHDNWPASWQLCLFGSLSGSGLDP